MFDSMDARLHVSNHRIMTSLWIFVIAAWSVFGADNVPRVNDWCVDDDGYEEYCITVYGDPGNRLTWQQAKKNCMANYKQLMYIPTNEVNERVKELTGTGTAWVGGRRLSDNQLVDLNGQELDVGIATTNTDNNALNCLYARKEGGEIQFNLDQCSEKTGQHLTICAVHTTADKCDASTLATLRAQYLADVCYVTHNDTTDWFKSHNRCGKRDGELLTEVNDTALLMLLPNHGQSAWLGYWRKPWIWDHLNEPIRYFKWHNTFEDSGKSNLYMVVNRGNWFTVQREYDRPYHVCYNGSVIPVTTTAAPTTEPPTTHDTSTLPAETQTGTDDVTGLDRSKSTAGQMDSSDGPGIAVYVGSAVGGLAVISVVVVVTVCILRRKKSQHPDKSSPTFETSAPETLESHNIEEYHVGTQPYEMVTELLEPPKKAVPDLDLSNHVDDDVMYTNVPSNGNSKNQATSDSDLYDSVKETKPKPRVGIQQDGTKSNPQVMDLQNEYATVDKTKLKPKITDLQDDYGNTEIPDMDMEDVVVDNVLYGDV